MNIEKPPIKKEGNTKSKYGFSLEITKRFLQIENEKDLIKRAEESISNPELTSLGKGNNAEVFAIQSEDGKFSELCVKKIFNNPDVIINDIESEAMFQSRVLEAGVRTPRYVMALEDKETKQKYIIMELIKGSSLSGGVFPDGYDYKKFFKELRAMVAKMHEANVHHRDLHGGNIMIDEKGEPVIIDFGAAGYGVGDDLDSIYRADGVKYDNAQKRYVNFYNEKLPRDIGKIDYLEKEIKATQ